MGISKESTKSKPRKKRTPQEKYKIVMEGLRGDHGSIAALCNAYGITQTNFYRWRDILMEDGSRLFERGGVGGDCHHEGASASVTVHGDRRQGVEKGKSPGEAEGVLRAFQRCLRAGLNESSTPLRGHWEEEYLRTRIGTDRHYFMGRPHCFFSKADCGVSCISWFKRHLPGELPFYFCPCCGHKKRASSFRGRRVLNVSYC